MPETSMYGEAESTTTKPGTGGGGGGARYEKFDDRAK
jgi:hypothetical protein